MQQNAFIRLHMHSFNCNGNLPPSRLAIAMTIQPHCLYFCGCIYTKIEQKHHKWIAVFGGGDIIVLKGVLCWNCRWNCWLKNCFNSGSRWSSLCPQTISNAEITIITTCVSSFVTEQMLYFDQNHAFLRIQNSTHLIRFYILSSTSNRF